MSAIVINRVCRMQSPIHEHQAKHPFLTAALLVVMLSAPLPLIVLIGRWLKDLLPHPQLWQLVLALPLFILLLVGGMLFGAMAFLMVMKHFVDRKTLEPFYVYAGVPVASGLSASLFRWAYEDAEDSSGTRRT